jgi:hypothetical protein
MSRSQTHTSRVPFAPVRRDIAESMLEVLRGACVGKEFSCSTCGGVFDEHRLDCRLQKAVRHLEKVLGRCSEQMGRYVPHARCGSCLGCQWVERERAAAEALEKWARESGF